MGRKVTGGLLQVLQSSSAAWYQGTDGTRAYYEHPTIVNDGMIAVNGKRVCRLVDNGDWRPSPSVLNLILNYGVDLERGWTGTAELYGVHINDAIEESRYAAVRHHDGRIAVQKINADEAIIFVNGYKKWTVKITIAHNALEELGVETWTGWYPVNRDLLGGDSYQSQRRLR
jgi:hypothetical protein